MTIFTLTHIFQGGMKAVLWTDAVQIVIMLVGMFVLAIMGTLRAGGGQHVYEYALNNSRIQFDMQVF